VAHAPVPALVHVLDKPDASTYNVAVAVAAEADAATMTPAEPARPIAASPATSGRRNLEATHERTTYPQQLGGQPAPARSYIRVARLCNVCRRVLNACQRALIR
jgi:hypothetical protein